MTKIPVSSRPLNNVVSGDEVKRQLRQEDFGPLLDEYANRKWWQKPIYWDKHEEPHYIGDVLFTGFVFLFPFPAIFGVVIAVGGWSYALTYEGVKVVAICGAALTLGWWYLLLRKDKKEKGLRF